MTKEEFKRWLQGKFDEIAPKQEDKGDAWREIEAQEMLEEIGVDSAWDHVEQDMIFKCSDGYLASGYEIGAEGETVWPFPEGRVEYNMREVTRRDVEQAARGLEAAGQLLAELL